MTGTAVQEMQYLRLLERVLQEGTLQKNRTGINTRRVEGAVLEFDLRLGFPAITTKKLAFKSVVGELLGFLRGVTTASEFRELGCKIWDQNANDNAQWLVNPNRLGHDDLGKIYGYQWRHWEGQHEKRYDQLRMAVNKIIHTPEDRRIIISAWNPAELDQMALPPCHVMHQYICDPERKELSLCMYQRSCDMFLGVPFNIASYALLLEMMAFVTGYKAKKLTMFLADVHVYENHVHQAITQLERTPYASPTLKLSLLGDPFNHETTIFDPYERSAFGRLMSFVPEDIELVGYECHPVIQAPMAV